jgi:hypothetical protein
MAPTLHNPSQALSSHPAAAIFGVPADAIPTLKRHIPNNIINNPKPSLFIHHHLDKN